MAIDTAAKRASAIGVGLGFLRRGVVPDGSDLSADQRRHVNFLYADSLEEAVVEVEIDLEIAWEGTDNPAPRFAFVSGEAVTLNIALDPGVDVTGWTFRLDVRSSPYDATAEEPETDFFSVEDVAVTDAAAGEFSLELSTDDTGDLEATLYQYLLYRTDDGDELLLGRGLFRIHDAE